MSAPSPFSIARLVSGLFVGLTAGHLFALDEVTINSFDRLMKQSDPIGAFQVLATADPKNTDPQALSRVSDILSLYGSYAADIDKWQIQKDKLPMAALTYDPEEAIGRQILALPAMASLWLAKANLAWLRSTAPQLVDFKKRQAIDTAVEAYEKSLQLGLDDALVYERLGTLLLDRGDEQRSISYLEAAFKRRPDNTSIRYNLAYALYLQGKAVEALPHAQAVYAARPHDETLLANSRLLYADLLLSTGKAKDAATVYQAAIQADPANSYPLRRQVECYLVIGDADRIDQTVQKYLVQSATTLDSLNRLSPVFIKYHKEKQLVSLTKAYRIKNQKTNPEAAAGAALIEAQVLSSAGDTKEAILTLADGLRYLENEEGAHPLVTTMTNFKSQLER